MSRIIASAAIRGAYKAVADAEDALTKAVEQHGSDKVVELPGTAYFLPVIYAMTGMEVKTLSDMSPVLERAKNLLPPIPADQMWVPYLGHTLDAGMATLWADEVTESLKYLHDPVPYTMTTSPSNGHLWLGAANDVIMRERGIEFVDGTAPGFAAIVGKAPDVETAANIARELQQKNLYVFLHSNHLGENMATQLQEAGVDLGWDTRLVPFGNTISSAVFALGFASRAAMSFGTVKPGDFHRNLMYNKNRIFAFVIALGSVSEHEYARAAGAINYGFPVIADTDIPEILPRGVCTYEHVVSNVPHAEIVQKAVEVRGLKVQVTEIPIPVAYGPAFEGERVRKENVYVQFGGTKSVCFELIKSKEMNEVEDGKIEVVGPEIDDVSEGGVLPLGIMVDIAGRKMNKDYESILERQFHHWINGAEGVMHIGQRDITWIRISKGAQAKDFKIHHIGEVLRAKLMDEFSAIVDKVQVTIYTEEEKVTELLGSVAKPIYKERDERLGDLTDEAVDTFYSCTLCQSFAPNQVCVISPQRLGLCGAFNWLDGKVGYDIDPTGGHKPVPKGDCLDPKLGLFTGVNEFIKVHSHGALEELSLYSVIHQPMTSCGCFECIIAILPLSNGVMIVDRDHSGMTPCGMTFSTLAGTVGGGVQMPGFLGVGKYYLGSEKFISGDGGFARVVWMPKALKEQLKPQLEKQAERLGDPDFINKIADETVATTEEEVVAFLEKVGHPALALEPMM